MIKTWHLVARLASIAGLICPVVSVCAVLAGEPSPEEKAVAFLSREVPKWPVENKCFSCHNNGDGARALYAARKLGYRVKEDTLKSTTDWFGRPDRWEQNGGKAEFSDKRLAAIQFASALVAAFDAGSFAGQEAAGREVLNAAAKKVAAEQGKDGAWRIDAEGVLGSPVTYGPVLATVSSLKVLNAADRKTYSREIELAQNWLMEQRPKAVPDAAAVLLGLAGRSDEPVQAQIDDCLELLAAAQDKSGGWGPYRNSAPEPFDTALVVLALVPHRERKGIADRLSHGRAFLVESQLKDGSWVETTRPAGAESYAQRLSTTGWATLALLATSAGKPRSVK